MRLREEKLVQIVKQEGPKLGDAKYIQALVGAFMRNQRVATQYIISHDKELGAAGIVTTLLHAEIISRAISLEIGRRPPPLSLSDLDLGAQRAKVENALAQDQPAALDYLKANVGADSGFNEAQTKVAHEILTMLVLAYDQAL